MAEADAFTTLWDALDAEPDPRFAAELRSRLQDELSSPTATTEPTTDGGAGPMSDRAPGPDRDDAYVEPPGRDAGRRRRRGGWLLAVAAVLVLILGAVALVARTDDDAVDTADTGPTASTATTPPPTAPPEPGWAVLPDLACEAAPSNPVAVTTAGTVWVPTDAGLQRWDGEAWQVVAVEPGGAVEPAPGCDQPVAQAVAATPDGALWVATDGAVVRVGPDGSVEQRSGDVLTSLVVTDDGWAAGRVEIPVDQLGGPAVLAIVAPDGTSRSIEVDGFITALAASGQDVWVGTSTGVRRLDRDAGVLVDADPDGAFDGAGVAGLAAGPDGTLWAMAAGPDEAGVLYRNDGGGWTTVAVEAPLFAGPLTVAPDGSVWAVLWPPEGPADPALQFMDLPGLVEVRDGAEIVHPLTGFDTLEVPDAPFGLTADGTSVWIEAPPTDASGVVRFTP